MSGESVEVVPRGYRVGDWEVADLIGAGGWGTVYEGRSVGGADGAGGPVEVALKFLPTSGLAPRQARGMVETARRETELGRRARHPRLIRLLDSVTLSEPASPALDGAVVLVMERAEHSLRDRLGDPPASGRPPLSAREGARLLTEVCEGLAHLHGLGWVHGDLKPDNVLVMADGSVRLSDFGLSVELDGTHAYIPPLGTPDYLPPERWRAPLGERGVQIRRSTDIWALGIMIHQVFTGGASPFPGATPAARAAAAQEYAAGRAPLRMDMRVPPLWRGLAADCLTADHADRAAHTAESLLARVRAGRERPAPSSPPHRRGRTALAATLAAVVCGAGAGWAESGREDRPVRAGTMASGRTGQAAGDGRSTRVEVFNAEKRCRAPGSRDELCSLGLAIDPLEPYTAENVVTTRVWHGDALAVDCRLARGAPVVDETGARSTRWFRVRLPAGEPRSTAWLPAVRTKDRPQLPECPGRAVRD
ncbi:serine/threonine protein kinase [Streptomyces carminius]|uniref:Serine/threonine protein kinase n=1 Tax=Streptomyces carminius TaxID=2665496 RepID=A0A2M8LXT4_9ACTN|nr:serine/threonine-protein kinase [Streptomyces carminius]PJE96734.1 serine/threonine protein kinase [Streptomyces carminius]